MRAAQDRLFPLNIAIGERFGGKFVVTDFLGAGGMSVVVAARHEQLGQNMAVKFFAVPPGSPPNAMVRFFREARAAASLRSEHIVRVTDAGTDEAGRPFIAMEQLLGENLAELLRRNGPLPVDDAVGYILQTCEGIAEAHAAGIVHRDLKPENLFVTRRIDGSPLIKVLDFGIVKMLAREATTDGQALSQPNSLMGTPLYMAPEQLRAPGDIDARTDVWAIGLILYELLTGRTPFAAATAPETFSLILGEHEPPALTDLRPDLPAPLAAAIMGCLRRDMSLRTANVGLLATALVPWAPSWAVEAGTRAARVANVATAGSPVAADQPVTTEVSSKEPRRRLPIAAVVAVLLLGAGMATAWALAGRDPGAARPAEQKAVVAPARSGVRAGEAQRVPMDVDAHQGTLPAVPPVPGASPTRRSHAGEGTRGARRRGNGGTRSDGEVRDAEIRGTPGARIDPLEGRE